MTEPVPEGPRPTPSTRVGAWAWFLRALGVALLVYEVSPLNPAGFRWGVAVLTLGLMGVVSFVRLDLAEAVRGVLPQSPSPPAPPPSPSGALPGPPPADPPTDEATTP